MYDKNEIMRIVFEKSTELIFIFHENGDIFGANPRAKEESGYGENIYAMNIINMFPTVFLLENNQIVIIDDKACSKEELDEVETVIYCDNQTCFPVLLNYNKVSLNEDTGSSAASINDMNAARSAPQSINDMSMPNKLIGICRAVNISERKAAIKQRKKALNEITKVTKVKNEFIANVTHELRTPLNGIKGLVSSLYETDIDDEQKRTLDVVMHCCNNMSKIINDILDISKIEAGRMTIEKQEFDLNQFLKNIVDINANIISEKGLKFVVSIGKGIPVNVIGDELRLGQIINNFLSNAVKFTEMGSVTLEVVKTFESESEIELFFMIGDTGIGIAKESMNRLFMPFSQIDGSITRHFGGTGLGLSICRQLVELMGGSIQVESEEGRGSTFSFTIRLDLPDDGRDLTNRMPIDGSMRLKHEEKVKKSIQSIDFESMKNVYRYMDDYKEPEDILIESLEKLVICIEMGTWERAEIISSAVKKLMPEENKELSRAAFRIVLSVRKCDYEKSMHYIKELKDMLGIIKE